MAHKKLSEKFHAAIQSCQAIAETFRTTNASWQYRLGFMTGAAEVVQRMQGFLSMLEAFERTELVQMVGEAEVRDTLQWNLAQLRAERAILECEGQSTWDADNQIRTLEQVLRGEKRAPTHI